MDSKELGVGSGKEPWVLDEVVNIDDLPSFEVPRFEVEKEIKLAEFYVNNVIEVCTNERDRIKKEISDNFELVQALVIVGGEEEDDYTRFGTGSEEEAHFFYIPEGNIVGILSEGNFFLLVKYQGERRVKEVLLCRVKEKGLIPLQSFRLNNDDESIPFEILNYGYSNITNGYEVISTDTISGKLYRDS
jgi:hypothetical protein